MNLVVLTEFSERRVRAGVGRGEKRQAVTLLFSQLAAVIVAMCNSVEFHVLSLSQLRTRTLCFLLGWNILFPVFNRGPLVPTYRKTKKGVWCQKLCFRFIKSESSYLEEMVTFSDSPEGELAFLVILKSFIKRDSHLPADLLDRLRQVSFVSLLRFCWSCCRSGVWSNSTKNGSSRWQRKPSCKQLIEHGDLHLKSAV